MISGRDYRSEIFKIAGFGFMSPLEKYILSILDYGLEVASLKGVFFLCLSLVFGYFGIILINRGLEIADGKN